jgi:toxin-antitoxin system PIN domain toxin
MRESTTSFLFPDINVWVALTCERHVHHVVANDWLSDLHESSRLLFCRFTQLGLLRLLTADAVMGAEVMSQRQAWTVYDHWLQDERVEFLDEPSGLDGRFRALTRSRQAAPKVWADGYLAAFASAARLTLVTFDRGLRAKAQPAVLLSE